MELYVYYRVPLTQRKAGQAQVQAAQQTLCRQMPGLQARLLQRRDEGPEPASLTWMEIYQHPAGLTPQQLAQIQASMTAWPSQREGDRHNEVFTAQVDAASAA